MKNQKIKKEKVSEKMSNKLEQCKWEPQGNGYYLCECGALIRDEGRFDFMMIKNYGSKRKPRRILDICPNCKKTIVE